METIAEEGGETRQSKPKWKDQSDKGGARGRPMFSRYNFPRFAAYKCRH